MKKAGIFSIIAVLVLFMTLLISCDSENGSDALNSALYAGGAEVSDYYGSEEKSELGETADQVTRPAGLMTASAWNDNLNYSAWENLFLQGEEENGKFFNYLGDKSWGLNSLNRIKVTVKNGDFPIAGAKVTASSADGTLLFSAVTDAAGVAYLFTDEESGNITATASQGSASAEFSAEEREITLLTEGTVEKKNIIDIMFVIDVTGSMGDELIYLQNEIADVIDRVANGNEGAVINLALLFYRDSVDKEEFAYHDFVNVTSSDGLAAVQAALAGQEAEGGGDYPESVDEALELAVGKQWSSGASTKLIFHILDAPPHQSDSNKARLKEAIESAAEKGIRICPILCSGADYLTEYLTRQSAVYTGGTFIFITDDSGIGNEHHDPDLPNVTVEALNSLLVRLINGYHTGEFADPVDWRQEV